MRINKFLVAIIILIIVSTSAACGNSKKDTTVAVPNPSQSTFTTTIVTMTTTTNTMCSHYGGEATCTSQAICEKCGQPYGIQVEHSFIEIEENLPTCEENGYSAHRVCQGCNYIEGKIVLSATGHQDMDGDYVCDNGCNTTIVHDHDWMDATCQAPKTCSKCGLSEGDIASHFYESGFCITCGISDAATHLTNAIISFNNISNRVSYSENLQVWMANGVTFINNKNDSLIDVAGNYDPIRCYGLSEIIIQGIGINKIEFFCYSNAYATILQNSISECTDVKISVNGKVVTVEFDRSVDAFVIESITGQIRLTSIVINSQN